MKRQKVKVWFICPVSHADELRVAVGDAGLGTIGNYSHCCFVTRGNGYSKPNTDASPYAGTAGEIEEIDEVAIEFVCFEDQVKIFKEVLKTHHPYDEVAVDVWELMSI